MKSLQEVLTLSSQYLEERGIHHPRRQAELLLCDALGLSRMQLYLEFERPLTEPELTLCRERLIRRAKGEPIQYIHGAVEFYGTKLKVNPAVLIPRQETEILVDKIVQALRNLPVQDRILWDLCCGSGCLGIALKKYFPGLQVTLSDISIDALNLAQLNAANNQVEVECLQGDLLKPFKDRKAHFVVCNPPYLSKDEYQQLDREVKEYEPSKALVAGLKGTEYYESLAVELPRYLHPGARVWLEIGYLQGESVRALFASDQRWTEIKLEKDWAGHDRFICLTY